MDLASKLEKSYNICELNDGRNLGVCIMEIMSIPKIDMFPNEENVIQMISKSCLNLLDGIYQFSNNIESALEILWVSEPVSGQTYNAKIRIFVILRVIGCDNNEVQQRLFHMQSICKDILEYNKYTVRRINAEDDEFFNILENLDEKNMNSIVKEENIIESYCPITNFYYSTDVIPNSMDKQMDKIIKILTQYPYSAVSFQVIPTRYDYDEMDSIKRANYLLNKLVVGFPDDYYGEIKDNMAEQPQKVFEYYYNQFNKPLFLYNIIIYSDYESALTIQLTISNQIKNEADSGGGVKLKNTNLNDSGVTILNDFFTLPWNINKILLSDKRNFRFWDSEESPKSLFRLPYVISAEEAVSIIKLPISANESTAGINVTKFKNDEANFLPGVIDFNNIQLGYLIDNNFRKLLGINAKSLSKHMFISGTPGSGKTTFAFNILCQLFEKNIPFLVIEPTKSEYRVLIDVVDKLQVFTPGKNDVVPFIINPFIPPKNVKLQSYKSSLMTAFSAAFSNNEVLKLLYREAINICYTEHGWRDNSISSDRNVTVFGLFEFINTFKRVIETKKYSNEIRNNIESAGVLRLMDLINQDYTTFDNINSIPIEDLISNPTVIELDAIENTEQKSLIISLLLINIFAYISANTNEGTVGKTNYVLLLEEAHVLLASSNLKLCSDGEANPNYVAVELINRILAEKRSSGLGMIIADQSPQKVSLDVIKNTSTKVIFRTVEQSDREIIAKSMNMNESQRNSLSILRNGEAYCFFEEIDKPQIIQTINVRETKRIKDFINDERVSKHITYWITNSKKLIPYKECLSVGMCTTGCNNCIRTEARYISERIFYSHIGVGLTDQEVFIKVIDNVDELINECVDNNNPVYMDSRLNNCVIIQLLRKVNLDTQFGKKFNLEQRVKYLKLIYKRKEDNL